MFGSVKKVQSRKIAWALVIVAAMLALLATTVYAAESARFKMALTGAEEVPVQGDPDGVGKARVTLDRDLSQVCFEIRVAKITLPATSAHIHSGVAGVSGPAVVTLTPPDASGMSSGCVAADLTLITEIRNNPSGYYVNVHNSDFPAGAVRGQLSR